MIYVIAIAIIGCSYYWYGNDTNLFILMCSITIIVTLCILEMSIGRYIDIKFKNLIEYMEGHIEANEAIEGKDKTEDNDKDEEDEDEDEEDNIDDKRNNK